MKKTLLLSLLLGVMIGGTCVLSDLARADSTATASGSAGAQVTRESNAVTIVGVGSGAAGVDTNRVQGSTTGSGLVMLRISWGNGRGSSDRSGLGSSTAGRDSRGTSSDRGRGVASPPGAPEMPADVLFGSGFLVLGFGLLLTRKRLW